LIIGVICAGDSLFVNAGLGKNLPNLGAKIRTNILIFGCKKTTLFCWYEKRLLIFYSHLLTFLD
jgi:hypothetical protein